MQRIIKQIIRKMIAIHPLHIIYTYCFCVLRGYWCYKKLCNTYKCHIYFQYYAGTGDVYIDAGMLDRYNQIYAKKKDYVFVVNGQTALRVAALFPLKKIVALQKKDAYNLLDFTRYISKEKIYITTVHYHDPAMYTACAFWTIGLHDVSFFWQYCYSVFKDMSDKDFILPVFQSDLERVKKIFEEKKLSPGKTVLLAPYSYTLSVGNEVFWIEVANKLKMYGYSVCTNIAGDKEIPIKGTVGVRIPYEYCKCFLEYAGAFIGARSGICEIISNVSCKKVIVYPKEYWPKEREMEIATAKDIFSLSKLPKCKDIYEVEITTENIVEKIIDTIISGVTYEDNSCFL